MLGRSFAASSWPFDIVFDRTTDCECDGVAGRRDEFLRDTIPNNAIDTERDRSA
jgi:hypothetical protein